MYMTSPNQQKGAALVVGLMILLLATFLAVASMNNANVQERMAANSQNVNLAFQAAESAVDEQVALVVGGDTSNISQAHSQYGLATPVWPTDSYDAGNADVTTNVEVRGMGEMTLSAGNSIDADESSVRLTGVRFEMHSTSTVAGSGARVTIVQGLEYR